MPMPTIDIVEKMLGAIQEDGLFQRLVDRAAAPIDIWRVALVSLTVAIFLYGLKKLFGVRSNRPQPGPPYRLGVQPSPHTPLVGQRMKQLAAKKRFDEPARALITSWFREVAGIEPTPGGKIAYEVRGGLLERRRLGSKVDELWKFATGVSRMHDVDKARLLTIAKSLEQLGDAVSGGRIVFSGRSTPANRATAQPAAGGLRAGARFSTGGRYCTSTARQRTSAVPIRRRRCR